MAPVSSVRVRDHLRIVSLGLALSIGLLRTTDCRAEPARAFRIEADVAASALTQFAIEAHWSVLFLATDQLSTVRLAPLYARTQPEQALLRLLAGTGLGCRFVAPKKVVVDSVARTQNGPNHCAPPPSHSPWTLGRLSTTSMTSDGEAHERPERLAEVVVTGSHVHGNYETGSLQITLLESDPLWAGANTVADVIRRLPADFRGGPSEDTRWVGAESQSNSGVGAGGNLRGLGSRATLVLMDERRITPSGSQASFVDLLNFPLLAVERIETVLDGASAVYGSDAVGGVINVIMRKHYDGAKTFADFGTGTDGTQHQARIGQIFGKDWDSGGGVLVLEDYHRSALPAARRSEASSDLTPWGPNLGSPYSSPGTLLTGLGSFVMPAQPLSLPVNFQTLQAGQRLSDLYADSDMLPNQRRLSTYLYAHQTLIDGVDAFVQFLGTQRNASQRQGGDRAPLSIPDKDTLFTNVPPEANPLTLEYDFGGILGPEDLRVKVRTFNIATGVEADLAHGWHASTSVADALEQESQYTFNAANLGVIENALLTGTPADVFNPLSGSPTTTAAATTIRAQPWFGMHSEMWQFHLAADGPIVRLPGGGDLKLATGTEYRNQLFRTGLSDGAGGPVTSTDLGRRLYAAYGEVLIPVIGPENTTCGLRKLDLSLAARYEDYSDFGSALTPRYWLQYSPVDGVQIRASYARSTRAPNLGDLNTQQNVSFLAALPDPAAPGGTARVLAWAGGNASLTPERATSRTVGLHLAPLSVPAFQADLNYINTAFTDRIQTTGSVNNQLIPTLLTDPQYQEIVNRQPTGAQQQSICASTLFAGQASQCPNAPINAIVDLRSLNIAALYTQGIDFSVSGTLTAPVGAFYDSLTGVYLLKFSQKQTPQADAQNLLNTINNPINLQIVETLGWRWQDIAAQLTAYYSNGYRDPISIPTRSIRSWRSLDADLAYTIGEDTPHGLRGITLELNVQNFFNRQAPRAVNRVSGIGYDEENADLTGRIIQFTISKKW